jgi:hypothetical protein
MESGPLINSSYCGKHPLRRDDGEQQKNQAHGPEEQLPGIHVFTALQQGRRGWPGQAPTMTQ